MTEEKCGESPSLLDSANRPIAEAERVKPTHSTPGCLPTPWGLRSIGQDTLQEQGRGLVAEAANFDRQLGLWIWIWIALKGIESLAAFETLGQTAHYWTPVVEFTFASREGDWM